VWAAVWAAVELRAPGRNRCYASAAAPALATHVNSAAVCSTGQSRGREAGHIIHQRHLACRRSVHFPPGLILQSPALLLRPVCTPVCCTVARKRE
jgi:hypothetical protein